MEESEFYDTIIVGSGPAAYTAALFLKDRKVLMLLGSLSLEIGPGGQLTTTTTVDNYPGFPKGTTGPEMMKTAKKQANDLGIEQINETVIGIKSKDNLFIVQTKKLSKLARTVVIATGASAKKLVVPGSDTYWNKGISACAVCDGFFFRDKVCAVIGGGDTALEETLYLSKICKKVLLVHRRREFRARADNVEKARKIENVEFITPYHLEKCVGDNEKLNSIILVNNETGEKETIEVDGLFFAIGHVPNTSFLKGESTDFINIRENGYVKTHHGVKCSRNGVFACGDVQDFEFRQAVTAAASGCEAALEVAEFLRNENA
ncbi:Thioredoxin reductase [Enterospora canceri]|uniref:Thioredoxin reductase n=1 Tax=Enterospora canceri TaxID=1081671 RepID=A0A1Y1S9J7_9MICR|nr:Thioredoxin reductase [Enterospora canceri]